MFYEYIIYETVYNLTFQNIFKEFNFSKYTLITLELKKLKHININMISNRAIHSYVNITT